MHFLLVNDDGIHAPGIAALEAAVATLPDATITVAAPFQEQSQCAHRVTTREEIVVEQLAERRYSVAGTPADCIRVALFGLGIRPDYVVSGVNAGGNMGQDLHISGTLAGAREAAFHGVPAAAFSHYLIKGIPLDWPRVAAWTARALGELLARPLVDGEFWNVNYPHLPPGPLELPPWTLCHPCRAPLNVSYEATQHDDGTTGYRYTASYASRPAGEGSDVGVCFGGGVAVSRLRI